MSAAGFAQVWAQVEERFGCMIRRDRGVLDEATAVAWHERGEWLAAMLQVRIEFHTARRIVCFEGLISVCGK
ncbi:hypothetical protein A6A25_04210 [Saccharothrix sp. CB00851]|nr:hypothetical protein A6A25_04210 [Saccharothrix sp. CB00851]